MTILQRYVSREFLKIFGIVFTGLLDHAIPIRVNVEMHAPHARDVHGDDGVTRAHKPSGHGEEQQHRQQRHAPP